MNEDEEKEEEERKQKQYLRVGVCVVILVIIVIVVPTVLATRGKKRVEIIPLEPTFVPSSAPSPMPTMTPTSGAFASLKETIKVLYDDDDSFFKAFNNPESPQNRAARWLADEDAFEITPASDRRMINRYALATIYFALNGDDWFKCGRDSTSCGDAEWLSNSNECTWMDVACTDAPEESTITELFFGKFLVMS